MTSEVEIQLEPMETAPRDARGFIAISQAGYEVPVVFDPRQGGFALVAISVDPITGRRIATVTQNCWSKENFKGWRREN